MRGVDLDVVNNSGVHAEGLLSRHPFHAIESSCLAGCGDVRVAAHCHPNQLHIAERCPQTFLTGSPGQKDLIQDQMGPCAGHRAEAGIPAAFQGPMLRTESDGGVLLEGDSRSRAVTPSRKGVDESFDAESQPDARENFLKIPSN